MKRDIRRLVMFDRLKRVADVERIQAVQTLANAQSNAARIGQVVARCNAMLEDTSGAKPPTQGDQLKSRQRFASAMIGVRSSSVALLKDADNEVRRAGADVTRLDRKLEVISERLATLHRNADQRQQEASQPWDGAMLARSLLKPPKQEPRRGSRSMSPHRPGRQEE